MSVTTLVRYKGGKPEEMVSIGKTAKPILEKHGAEYVRLGRFHTGNYAGEWLAVIRYPNWAAYGKAQEGMATDQEYQKVLAHLLSLVEMTGREVIVGYDI